MSNYKAQLLAVEAKLAKDPENEQLLSLKETLLEFISLSCELEENEDEEREKEKEKLAEEHQSSSSRSDKTVIDKSYDLKPSSDRDTNSHEPNLEDKNHGKKRSLTEVELMAKQRERNRKKKARLREKVREETEIAESEKQSWQSFANKKGLKGITKKSIFASPHSVTGKVGVGTNGIADAPSAAHTAGTTIAFGKHNKY